MGYRKSCPSVQKEPIWGRRKRPYRSIHDKKHGKEEVAAYVLAESHLRVRADIGPDDTLRAENKDISAIGMMPPLESL